ncbi:response regulator [Reichenbachiella sp.]|uniref:response regulator transcription factor n=1 Tax=Reichenbachiella sp. TaxID=2184521 RepID=UPI003BAE4598
MNNQTMTEHSPHSSQEITIGMADDQQLFLKSLSTLINQFNHCQVIVEGMHGKDLWDKLERLPDLPDIVLLDVNMPVMGGIATAQSLAKAYPGLKLVALSMKDDDSTIISMLKAGCCAYLLKDIHPAELELALKEIHEKGFYNADADNIRYRRMLTNELSDTAELSDMELTFLQYACSDLTYKQIADKMNKAVRTVDGYRESVFQKFKVQSRVGMAMEAIRRELVTI